MRKALLLLLLPWLCAAIPDQPPAPILLGAEESAQLAAGQVVVRVDAGGESGGGATGVVDVAAPFERAWAALLDMPARVGEVGGLRSVTNYTQEERTVGTRWELKVLTTSVVFHLLYHLEPERGWVRYALDPSRPNDLVTVEGAYQVYAVPGGTRIVYRSESDSGRPIPQWVKRWLAVDSLTDQLLGIKARAEAPR